jgi:hypothetical protein
VLASEPFPPFCSSCPYFINWYQSSYDLKGLIDCFTMVVSMEGEV